MISRRVLGVSWLLAAACSAPAQKPATRPVIRPMAIAEPEPEPTTPPVTEPAKRGPLPGGPSSLSIHVPPGKRQPLALDGTIDAMRPARGRDGLDAWTEVVVQPAGQKTEFYLLAAPDTLALPFTVGDRVHVDIDCRKGGWHRVCDGKIVDASRRVLAIISGSGDEELAKGWSIERGPVATSEIHPGKVRVVEHTHALTFSSERASATALPHQWVRILVHGRSYLVQGHETVWEGPPPPDARDHREFAIVLEK